MLFQSYSNGRVYFKDNSDILDLDKLSEDGVLSIDADTPKKISNGRFFRYMPINSRQKTARWFAILKIPKS